MNPPKQKKSGYGIFDDKVHAISNWTLDDADRETKKWRAENGINPSPMMQWAIWHRELPKLHKEWKEGRAPALMEAIDYCGRFRLPLQPWCTAAISHSVACVQNFTARTWDEALGAAHKKGARLTDLRREYKNKGPAIIRVLELRESANPETLERALQLVAPKYHISVELLERWYYEYLDKYPITEEVTTKGSITHKTGTPIPKEE